MSPRAPWFAGLLVLLAGCADDPLRPPADLARPPSTAVPVMQATSGTTLAGWVELPATVSGDWEIGGVADMTADGKPDVVWQNRVTRQTGVWVMDGTAYLGWRAMGSTESGDWRIGGVARMTHARDPDIVWHNRQSRRTGVWIMNGTAYGGWVPMVDFESGDWEIGGVADMTGDARADVVWQNRATRQTGVWVMDGPTYLRWVPMVSAESGDWQVGGVADMTGDGMADVVWQNRATRQTGVWVMNGTSLAGWVEMPRAESEDWEIGGVADMTGDGLADILWQNRVTRKTGVWIMGGGGRWVAAALLPPEYNDRTVAPEAINHLGHAIGYAGGAFLVQAGRPSSVVSLGIYAAYAINDAGDVAGLRSYSGDAVLRTANGGLITLPIQPRAINGQRQVVGTVSSQAALWTPDGLVKMIAPGVASSINEDGAVVGTTGGRAFLWTARAGLQLLATPSGHGSGAAAVNDHGVAVGWVDSAGARRPAAWTPAGQLVLLDLEPSARGTAVDINNSGVIVGAGGGRTLAWISPTSPAQPLGSTHSYVKAINNRGEALGKDLVHGAYQAVVWTFVP